MRYLGRAIIACDGLTLDTQPGASIDLGGVNRKPIAGNWSVGYAEELKPATVECELNVSADTPLEFIRKIAGAVVTFRADTGQTWLIANAFAEETLKITGGEGGKVKVKLTGDPAEGA